MFVNKIQNSNFQKNNQIKFHFLNIFSSLKKKLNQQKALKLFFKGRECVSENVCSFICKRHKKDFSTLKLIFMASFLLSEKHKFESFENDWKALRAFCVWFFFFLWKV